jgi:hypothetical protein
LTSYLSAPVRSGFEGVLLFLPKIYGRHLIKIFKPKK